MNWLYQFKIKQILVSVAALVIGVLVANIIVNYTNLNQIKEKSHKQMEEVLPNTFDFLALELSITKIHLWLLDASATRSVEGFTDGLGEAQSAYNEANKHLDNLIKMHQELNESEMVSELQEFKRNLALYYTAGLDMAKAYIEEDTTTGNAMMLKFEPFAERLIPKLDSWLNEHLQESKAIAQDINKSIDNAISSSIIFSALVMIITLIAFGIINKILASIQVIDDYLSKLATLDFTTELRILGKNEIALISQNLSNVIDSIKEFIAEVKASSAENSSISHELSATAMVVGKKVEEVTVVVNKTTQKAKEVTAEIDTSVNEANLSKEKIAEANNNLDAVVKNVTLLTNEVKETSVVEAEMADKIEQLSSEANEVKNVLTVISDIADQTNLLALNAAIEAARAGEHGRGFAVVADEVRKLAERTQKSLVEIQSTINIIVQSIMESSQQINSNSEKIQKLASISADVEDKIHDTVAIIHEANSVSEKTIESFEDTGKDVSVITNEINEVNEIVASNARSVEEIAAASEHLSATIEEVNTKMQRFRV